MLTVAEIVTNLKKAGVADVDTLAVLGTGWNAFVEEVKEEKSLPYAELCGVGAGVPGHQGRLVIAKQGKTKLALMVGRFHTYEGYTSEEVTRLLQALAQLGLKRVILTAAAGALNTTYQVGDFVVLNDIITVYAQSPLSGPAFCDLSEVFVEAERQRAVQFARDLKLSVQEGVYAYVRGPHFETPADKRKLMNDGADVVGMSIVPEVIMARSLGVEVLGIAYVTNLAFVKHDHQQVLAAARSRQSDMAQLLAKLTTS